MRCERLTAEPRLNGSLPYCQCDAAADVRIRTVTRTTIGYFCRAHAGTIQMHQGWTSEEIY